jgi:hypothetical protein
VLHSLTSCFLTLSCLLFLPIVIGAIISLAYWPVLVLRWLAEKKSTAKGALLRKTATLVIETCPSEPSVPVEQTAPARKVA